MRAQVAHDVDPRVHRLHFKATELAAPLNTFACVFKAWRDFKALNLKTGRQHSVADRPHFCQGRAALARQVLHLRYRQPWQPKKKK